MTIRLPVLTEYESTVAPLTRRQAELLGASGVVTVAPFGDGGWTITAASKVGSLTVDGVELLIRPKIKPENLFLLLEAGLPEQAWRSEAFEYATTFDLLSSVIAFFARTVETTLARGVLRSYRTEREAVVALRGRLDLRGQLARPGVLTPVPCEFDNFTADNRENRYLRAAVRLAARVPTVHPADRGRLMQQLVALEEVSDVIVPADDLDGIVMSRLNAHYAPALRLARLVLANLTLMDRRGGTAASSFMVDMNDLFQRFVTERLRRALRDVLDVEAEPPVHLAERNAVRMEPDLVFVRRGARVLVGDVKYKITRDAWACSADYYQLLAYTTALDLPEGLLIYCLADGGRPERSVTVKWAGKVLHTRALDLTGSPAGVSAELHRLASWIADRARSASPPVGHPAMAPSLRRIPSAMVPGTLPASP